MKNMEDFKERIYNQLVNRSSFKTEEQQKFIEKVSEGIEYAWNHWDADIVATYYNTLIKPLFATNEFIENYIENEDFEANGFDVKTIKTIFNL